jgi:hypothetical protein
MHDAADSAALAPGKQTLTSQLPVPEAPVQRRAESTTPVGAGDVHAAAAHGTSGSGTALPHLDRIQGLFGRHDVSHVQAYVGGSAAEGAEAMGAEAFATGDRVAFARTPDVHTAAHEAAHVVQQRGGVQLKGGVGKAGDRYEQHADAVADRVVRGESAEGMLDEMAGSSTASPSAHGPVQRKEGTNELPGADSWKEMIARWVTSGADSAHDVYEYFADLAAKYPLAQPLVNAQVSLAKAAAGSLVDTNPASVSWTGLGAMWLFELGPNPIVIGEGAVTTNDLKGQEGVQRVRDLAREEARKGTLTKVKKTWTYGQKEFYDSLKQSNFATLFLGSYQTQVSLSSQAADSVTVEFEVTNTSSWESGTRLRKAAQPGGVHQAIIPSRERGSGGIELGGNFAQIWRWSETLPLQ